MLKGATRSFLDSVTIEEGQRYYSNSIRAIARRISQEKYLVRPRLDSSQKKIVEEESLGMNHGG